MNTPKANETLPIVPGTEQLTMEEHLAQLIKHGVSANAAERLTPDGPQVYVHIDRHSVLTALQALPDAERLPLELELLFKAALEGTLDLPLTGMPVSADQYVFSVALWYLFGNDRAQALRQLWDVFRLWRAVRGVN